MAVVETWDAIRARRNVRTYEDRPIAAAELDRILEAGRLTPSSTNWQPWDFVLVTERDRLKHLAKVWQGAAHIASSAATIALVGPVLADDDFRRDWVPYDLGQATMSMLLAAADLGIGSGHGYVYDQALARQLLGLPDDKFCAYLIGFGYPSDRPLTPLKRPNRRAFEDVVHRDRW